MPLLADPETRDSISVADFEAAFARSHPSITYPRLQQMAAPAAVPTGPIWIIRMLTGKDLPLDVQASDAVEEVKEQIQDKEDIPPCKQRLIFAGRQLEDDDCTLAEYWRSRTSPCSTSSSDLLGTKGALARTLES